MLVALKIKSFGIIDELAWQPCEGFNVITGETGAGKSLVIDAVEALLSGKLDDENIRFGDDSSRVEAVFSLPDNSLLPHLHVLLEQNGVASDDDVLLMSCEFRRQGRTVMRINGSAVTRALLREISALLLDVHAQSQHLSLFDKRQHLSFLDAYADVAAQRGIFAENATRLYLLQDELLKLRRAETESVHRQEILRYQHDEICRAKLKDGEEEVLEQQRRVMASCEKLKALAYDAYQALNGEDESVALSRINEAMRAMNGLVALDPSLKPHADALMTAATCMEEVSREIRSYEERLEYDPAQLEEIESRLELIHTLKKKYGASVAHILQKQREIEEELATLDSAGEETILLENDITKTKTEMGQQAQMLSQKRLQAADCFEKAVEKELSDLGMQHVRFRVQITQKEIAGGIPYGDKMVAFAKDGADEVQFMASTNPGEPLKPLADIASTGEVSRFTLALKVALAQADATPVLVFDEIDIGVGGRSGDVIGKKLWQLARHHQVVCITHLPQIAVYAASHFNVSKAESHQRTTSSIDVLDASARIDELAAMLGGVEAGSSAHMGASELLKNASAWIETQK